MSNYDPDKTRFFSTEEGFNPGYVVGTFRRLFSELMDITGLIYQSNAMRISKERYTSSVDFLKAFETTMLAYRDVEPIGKLSTAQQQKILVMVDDVLKGKKECVQFQLNRAGNGLREVFTSEVFELTNKKQDK